MKMLDLQIIVRCSLSKVPRSFLYFLCILVLQIGFGAVIYPLQNQEAVSQDCTPPPSGLVSWWTGNGDANDSSDGNHGTLQNGAGLASGMVGQAFLLDGINDFVSVPDNANLDITNAITIDAWINPTKGGVTILDKTGSGDSANYRFFFGLADQASDFRLGFWNGSTFVLATNSIPNDQFSHVAMTLSHTTGIDTANVLKIYINGGLDSTHSIAFGAANDGPLRIGSDIIGRYFQGTIDEVELFNRELSQSEIQQIYNVGPQGKCAPVRGSFGPVQSS
jgi:hypothetical protein